MRLELPSTNMPDTLRGSQGLGAAAQQQGNSWCKPGEHMGGALESIAFEEKDWDDSILAMSNGGVQLTHRYFYLQIMLA